MKYLCWVHSYCAFVYSIVGLSREMNAHKQKIYHCFWTGVNGVHPQQSEAIFTNSSRTKFAKCSQTYSFLLGRVRGGVGGRCASLLLPPPLLPCRTRYHTSVQFTNFVRELLVNIASGPGEIVQTMERVHYVTTPSRRSSRIQRTLWDPSDTQWICRGWHNKRYVTLRFCVIKKRLISVENSYRSR